MHFDTPPDTEHWLRRLLVWSLHLGAWLVVLGGPGLVQAQGAAATPAAVVEMTEELRFQPPVVTVDQGQAVEWRNRSGFVHTVTAVPEAAMVRRHVALPAGAEAFSSDEILPGQSYSRRFEAPGVYRYICNPHEMSGMTGTIIVQAR